MYDQGDTSLAEHTRLASMRRMEAGGKSMPQASRVGSVSDSPFLVFSPFPAAPYRLSPRTHWDCQRAVYADLSSNSTTHPTPQQLAPCPETRTFASLPEAQPARRTRTRPPWTAPEAPTTARAAGTGASSCPTTWCVPCPVTPCGRAGRGGAGRSRWEGSDRGCSCALVARR
jgi:hypothetical protein